MTTSTAMPAVNLPHGGGAAFFMSGPMADMFQPMAEFLASIGTVLPATPTALLVVTAHSRLRWSPSPGPSPELIFDYYGFPPETYQLAYPAPGLPALATAPATHRPPVDAPTPTSWRVPVNVGRDT